MVAHVLKGAPFRVPVWMIALYLLTTLTMTTGCPSDDDPDPVNDVDVIDVINDIDEDVTPPDVVDDVVEDIDVIVPDIIDDVVNDVAPEVLPPGMARVQIIHDVSDPLAGTVDIYLDGVLFLEDFEYGTGTGFVEVNANQAYSVAVAGSESTSVEDALATFGPFTFDEGSRNVLIVSGVLDDDEFGDNPDGADIEIAVFSFDDARESSTDGSVDQALLFHGVTDAPAVTLVVAGTQDTLVDALAYGEFSNDYIDLPEGVTAFDVLVAGERVGSWQTTDVQGGDAYVFVVTGFVDATQNPEAPLRILSFAATTTERIDGEPLARAARIQVVHNAPNPELDSVSVWLNDEPLLATFDFREATPYLTVPSGLDLTFDLTATDATDTMDSVFAETVNLDEGSTHVAIVSGVDSEDVTHPDGVDIDLAIYTSDDAREVAGPEADLEFVVFHGIADATSIDLVVPDATDPTVLVNDLSYGQFSPRGEAAAAPTQLDITAVDDADAVIASFQTSLQLYEGKSIVAIASGLLEPPAGYASAALLIVEPEGDVTVIDPMGD